jgi:homocysteine S-methyltransferase
MIPTLPQLRGGLFLTDGGLETTLIFHDKLDLPLFAAFVLLKDQVGRATLRRYYRSYLEIAAKEGLGFVLESATWRASPDWAAQLGITPDELELYNRDAIMLLRELRTEWANRIPQLVISGCVGPRGDGYDPGDVMTVAEAHAYHAPQIATYAAAGVDMVTAITMTNIPEAIGVVRAARDAARPVAISFTVETDGRLPTGQSLRSAIETVDAATGDAPAYYMVNCAHPTHFAAVLEPGAAWTRRIAGLRANASKRSHQELNDAPDLDDGDPSALGREHAELLRRHAHIRVLGGCCGTDHRHVAAIGRACTAVDA